MAKSASATWLPMVESYLLEREQLQMVLLLVDGEIGPTATDLAMLEWLRSREVPHSVVATKHDKVKPSQRDNRRRELAADCHLPPADVLWVSAAEGVGIAELRQRVRVWLASSDAPGAPTPRRRG
jgi:GTP-binding protein